MGLGLNNGKGTPQLKALLIDLDDTLYRCATGLRSCYASARVSRCPLTFSLLLSQQERGYP
jgi:hypothetical protein